MTGELRSIRPLGKESMRGIEPSKVGKKRPTFEWVDPCSLFAETAYQRDLSENSTKQVRKTVAKFNWAHFKPPICVRLPESGNVLVCIDGQHTAMSAATHPDIDKIPVMVVDAADVKNRAAAFVGHNRDRISLTQMAIYHAELAAGDELAAVIDRACRASGAVILNKAVNLRSNLPAGNTIAVGTIRILARKQGEEALTRVLRLLTQAGRGPIKADEIAAVALILQSAGDRPDIDAKLRAVVQERSAEKWASVCSRMTAESGESLSSALASEWCRKLGIRLRGPSTNGGSKSAAGRLLQGGAPMKAMKEDAPAAEAVPRPAPTAPPQTPFRAKPIAPSPVLRHPAEPVRPPTPAPARKAEPTVELNGVTIDFAFGKITYRGRSAAVSPEALVLVKILARVTPAFLEGPSAAHQVWGRQMSDSSIHLGTLAAEVNNAKLGPVIKQVMKTGWMISIPS